MSIYSKYINYCNWLGARFYAGTIFLFHALFKHILDFDNFLQNSIFQIRMEQEIYDLLVTTAHKHGVSKAEIVRRGIVEQAKLTKA